MADAPPPDDDQNSSKSEKALKETDHSIKKLADRILPEVPHLLAVPTKTPYLARFPYENRNTPFEPWEVMQLQYMTLISTTDRGVAIPRGDWADEIVNPQSPASHSAGLQSGTSTPSNERETAKPRMKMSLADYKAGKRPTSAPKQSIASEVPTAPKELDLNADKESRAHAKRELPNGHSVDKSLSQSQPQVTVVSPSANEPHISKTRSPAPPRENGRSSESQTEFRRPEKSPPPKSLKRQLEDGNLTPPEKRMKVEKPSTPKTNFITKKPLPEDSPQKPVTISKSSTPTPNKDGKSKEHRNSNLSKSSAKHAHDSQAKVNGTSRTADSMPPLLSPLPPGLSSPDGHASGFSQKPTPTKSEKMKLVRSPKPKEKAPAPKSPEPIQDGPDNLGDSPISMPPLLSPTLPAFIERALEKAKVAAPVADNRREKPLYVDAPGVARPKSDKATRKTKEDKSGVSTPTKTETKGKDSPVKKEAAPVKKKTLVIKLKYKKRRSKDIQRILNLKPAPKREHLPSKIENSTMSSTSTPSRSDEKKRPRPEEDIEDAIPAKKVKPPPNIEITKPRTPLAPAFKSPALSGPSSASKGAFGTPKRGDAMKSVAMRRVDSGESLVHTPGTASISTPVSAEKEKSAKSDGTDTRSSESQSYRDIHNKYSTMGTQLKRQMDTVLKTKSKPRVDPTEDEKKLGAVLGVESIIAYMASFHAFDIFRHLERKGNQGDCWVSFFQLLPFVRGLVRPYPELCILILFLGGICADALDKVYIDRFGAETPSASPEYLKFRDDMVKFSRTRVQIWKEYRDQCRAFAKFVKQGASSSASANEQKSSKANGGEKSQTSLSFITAPGGVSTMPISEVKSIATKVLEEFATKNGVEGWEKRVEF